MATKFYLNFVPVGRIDAPVVKKIQVIEDKEIYIKRVLNNVDEVTEYDFTGTPPIHTQQSPHSYADTIYRYHVDTDGTLHVWVAVVTEDLPVVRYQEQEHSVQTTVWKASGEDNTIEAVSPTKPTWIAKE